RNAFMGVDFQVCEIDANEGRNANWATDCGWKGVFLNRAVRPARVFCMVRLAVLPRTSSMMGDTATFNFSPGESACRLEQGGRRSGCSRGEAHMLDQEGDVFAGGEAAE